MIGSIGAVLLGNFTLRFSTGLTGALLLFFLADLPEFGGPEVSAFTVGVMGALYFAAELILSPFFGILADRFGTHRLMQPGPIMGMVAVIATGLAASVPLLTNVPFLAGTRFLEGAAAAASVPAALGYIAIATSRNQALRGKVVARFEVATLGGVGVGSVVAGFLYSAIGPTAFYLNALVYGDHLPHPPLRRGGPARAHPHRGWRGARPGFAVPSRPLSRHPAQPAGVAPGARPGSR